ncbi:MAG: AMP-binding protein, partial [Aliishimia sp.]
MTLQSSPSAIAPIRPSLIDLLIHHAQTQAENTAFVLVANDGQETTFSFAQVVQETARFAHWMRTLVSQGDRVLLALDTSPEYVFAFLGALASGVIPVPLFPPESARKSHMARLVSVIADAEPALILTDGTTLSGLLDVTDVRVLEVADCPINEQPLVPRAVAPDDLAFLQYTSGSTSAPKGVMVSHDNIVANSHAMITGAGITSQDVCVTWLPIYHDMGLIGNILMPLVAGIKTVSMSPKRFLMRPDRWLKAISDHRGTVSGAPDFAYRLCANVVRDKTLSSLDLSTWRVAFSGSEPIRFSTLQQFSDRFAVAGFRTQTFLPCYGLAEATLAVTGISATREPSQTAIPGNSHNYVNCGAPLSETEIRIGKADFDFSTTPETGEIYVSSPSVTLGYWRNPITTAETFRTVNGTRWLRTGDLGFLSDGQLHLTGRSKDLIIVSGQNLYPQDIEAHVEAMNLDARNGRVAAYATHQNGSEGFGLALEVSGKNQTTDQLQETGQTIANDLATAFQIAPIEIVFLLPHALPRTSSGKLQRSRVQASYDLIPDQVLFRFIAQNKMPARAFTPLESNMAELWSEALDQKIADPDANFFVLGGSSIQALRLASHIEKQFGVVLPAGMLFADPTLKSMAAAIETAERAVPIPAGFGLGSVSVGGLGLYFWLLDGLGFGGVCHVCCGVSFEAGGRGDEGVCAAVLRDALERVVRRQQALRLRFARTADGDLSVCALPPEQGEVALRQLDLSDLAPSVAQARL